MGGYAGRVMVGNRRQPICIPAGTSKVVIRRMQEKLPRGSYMVEATDDDNLPFGVSVNHTYVNPTKAKQVSVILPKHQLIQCLDLTTALHRHYLGCRTERLGLQAVYHQK